MKCSKQFEEHKRVFTLENTDIEPACINRVDQWGTYTYSVPDARRILVCDLVFQMDCIRFGFPSEMNIRETESPDTFDVEVFWRDTY